MRTIKNWQDKARLVGDLTDFMLSLQHPIEKDYDENATLCVAVRESGARTTRLYSRNVVEFANDSPWGDGTIRETYLMKLDKETRDCLVSALKDRIEELRCELKSDL